MTKNRRFTAALAALATLIGAVAPGHPASARSAALVAFLGDSYTEGSQFDSGPHARYPELLSRELGVDHVVLAVGGSGYVNLGRTGQTYAAQVPGVPARTDVVVVYGSRNDDYTAGISTDVYRGALRVFMAIRDRVPHAQLLVVGPSYIGPTVPGGGVVMSAAVECAARRAGAAFVSSLDWFREPPPASVATDGLHPTDVGQAYLAERLAPHLRSALQRADRLTSDGPRRVLSIGSPKQGSCAAQPRIG